MSIESTNEELNAVEGGSSQAGFADAGVVIVVVFIVLLLIAIMGGNTFH